MSKRQRSGSRRPPKRPCVAYRTAAAILPLDVWIYCAEWVPYNTGLRGVCQTLRAALPNQWFHLVDDLVGVVMPTRLVLRLSMDAPAGTESEPGVSHPPDELFPADVPIQPRAGSSLALNTFAHCTHLVLDANGADRLAGPIGRLTMYQFDALEFLTVTAHAIRYTVRRHAEGLFTWHGDENLISDVVSLTHSIMCDASRTLRCVYVDLADNLNVLQFNYLYWIAEPFHWSMAFPHLVDYRIRLTQQRHRTTPSTYPLWDRFGGRVRPVIGADIRTCLTRLDRLNVTPRPVLIVNARLPAAAPSAVRTIAVQLADGTMRSMDVGRRPKRRGRPTGATPVPLRRLADWSMRRIPRIPLCSVIAQACPDANPTVRVWLSRFQASIPEWKHIVWLTEFSDMYTFLPAGHPIVGQLIAWIQRGDPDAPPPRFPVVGFDDVPPQLSDSVVPAGAYGALTVTECWDALHRSGVDGVLWGTLDAMNVPQSSTAPPTYLLDALEPARVRFIEDTLRYTRRHWYTQWGFIRMLGWDRDEDTITHLFEPVPLFQTVLRAVMRANWDDADELEGIGWRHRTSSAVTRYRLPVCLYTWRCIAVVLCTLRLRYYTGYIIKQQLYASVERWIQTAQRRRL